MPTASRAFQVAGGGGAAHGVQSLIEANKLLELRAETTLSRAMKLRMFLDQFSLAFASGEASFERGADAASIMLQETLCPYSPASKTGRHSGARCGCLDANSRLRS